MGNIVRIDFGVVDFPYSEAETPKKVAPAKKGKKAAPVKRRAAHGTQTTGDVAQILEDRYGVMSAFVRIQMPAITGSLEESLGGALESFMMGASPSHNPYGTFESEAATMFKTFLAENEFAYAGMPGVPTQAALRGVNHRLKITRGPERPSFVDTGLFGQSFQAHVKDAIGL